MTERELLARTLELLRLERQYDSLPRETQILVRVKGYDVFDEAAEMGVHPEPLS